MLIEAVGGGRDWEPKCRYLGQAVWVAAGLEFHEFGGCLRRVVGQVGEGSLKAGYPFVFVKEEVHEAEAKALCKRRNENWLQVDTRTRSC